MSSVDLSWTVVGALAAVLVASLAYLIAKTDPNRENSAATVYFGFFGTVAAVFLIAVFSRTMVLLA